VPRWYVAAESGTLSATEGAKVPGQVSEAAGITSNNTGLAHRAVPNPSIERTRTGRPRYARWPFSASRGLPARAAHVKR
jgi:hypothetical protein